VPRNESLSDIQKAYRDLALKYHPKNNIDPTAKAKSTEINEGYTYLGDLVRRKNYDDYRLGKWVPFTFRRISLIPNHSRAKATISCSAH
jgi:curved DNA-binding protein CbpA